MKSSRVVIIISLCVMWLGFMLYDYYFDRSLEIYFLDVGQGDSILIETPEKEIILIDGGPGDQVLTDIGHILPPWIRKIDILVLTHPHADHINGLLDVMGRYDVEKIIWNPICYDYNQYDEFRNMLSQMKNKEDIIVADQDIDLKMQSGVSVSILWPKNGDGGGNDIDISRDDLVGGDCINGFDDNVNNDSVILGLKYGEFDALFMGDAETPVEQELLAGNELYDIDILKAGHHCSRTASSLDFLNVVKPELAICSVGKDNKFGHPHEETLDRFREGGIAYLRTGLYGTIEIVSDGKTWRSR